MCVHFIMHSQWRERGPFSSLGYGAGSLQLDILKKKKKTVRRDSALQSISMWILGTMFFYVHVTILMVLLTVESYIAAAGQLIARLSTFR